MCRLELRTRYTQDRLGGSVSFGYSQDSANQWRKLLYIFGSKVAICVGDKFDQYELNYVPKLQLGLARYVFVRLLTCV